MAIEYRQVSWTTGDTITEQKLNNMTTNERTAIDNLNNILKQKEQDGLNKKDIAAWHLGFYLDENGDLCQYEEENNNG